MWKRALVCFVVLVGFFGLCRLLVLKAPDLLHNYLLCSSINEGAHLTDHASCSIGYRPKNMTVRNLISFFHALVSLVLRSEQLHDRYCLIAMRTREKNPVVLFLALLSCTCCYNARKHEKDGLPLPVHGLVSFLVRLLVFELKAFEIPIAVILSSFERSVRVFIPTVHSIKSSNLAMCSAKKKTNFHFEFQNQFSEASHSSLLIPLISFEHLSVKFPCLI